MPKRKRTRKKLKKNDVEQLQSMGFSEEVAKAALLSNSNVEDALNELLDQNEEGGTSSHSYSKRSRTCSPIGVSNNLSKNQEFKTNSGVGENLEEKKDGLLVIPADSSKELSQDSIFTFSPNVLIKKYGTFKVGYEKDRAHLLNERNKIYEKITWLEPQSKRFGHVKSCDNWSKGDDKIMLWFKKHWVEEEELINAELKRYQNELSMFDEELKYIDHMFQQKTIEFENEKTVANLVSSDIKSGQRMSADDRNLLLLSSTGKKLLDKYSCSICFSEYELKEFAFLSCIHGFCRACLKMMITTKIKDGKLENLYCPNIDDEGNNCKHRLTHEEVRLFIGEHDLFSKYERLQLHQTLNQTKDCRWCPRPGCETAMFGDTLTPMMTCPKCEMKFCFNCKTSEWHPGTTCEMFQQWKKENSQADAKFENWKNKNTTPCPECKSSIEKNGGCMHMTCLNCKHEFHWLTGEKWRGYDATYAAPWEEDQAPQNGLAPEINILIQNNQIGPVYRLRTFVNTWFANRNGNT